MPRREALQRLALLVGATLSLPVQAALRGETSGAEPLVFSADQQKLIADLAEIIFPSTDTPGAKAAGVDRFIGYVVGHCTVPAQQETFQKGLQQTDAFSQAAFGKPFSELDPTQQTEIVRQLTQREKPFFLNMRELTIVGFFTSELGATKVAEYLPVPGRFQGDIPLKPGQKVWAI
ncbi:gluconate 2-dehydrogenase subunit 3 family protein [Larkinella terrae]|uniref:Gluconate 2-dehydrogenase subunit 3 family protein n=1 Tax=Larkinella terrae TaxID=2025311 RepID=A0A7K0EQ13_9BACT|nr:gluconate 2-dehydrogenase subunit 3 family protein [Larkinella terrae]